MMNEPRAGVPDLREWLEADGLGGFASGTVSCQRTRRYHALLLAATQPPSGRMVLVNGFNAQVEKADGERIPLIGQRYVPDTTSPSPTAPVKGFSLDPWPQWIFALPGGRVVQEIFTPQGHAAVVLRWRWEGARQPARLLVRPFFSGRDFHALHHENPGFQFQPRQDGEGEQWQFYEGIPALLARSNGTYYHEPCWYRNFFYADEKARGMDSVEDLAVPGLYEFDLAANPAVLIFSVPGLGATLPIGGPLDVAETLSQTELHRRNALPNPRLRAADTYLVARGAGKTIIAGYPWFGDWGRDTFIAMRGLCLASGRWQEARDILTAWSGLVSQGMLPNRFPDHGEAPEYNSVDASLWFVIVVHEYLAAAERGDFDLAGEEKVLLAAVEAILEGYLAGTRFGIRLDLDGLIACGQEGLQLTWMDAKVGDWVVTPRRGKPVEIQALWLNALALSTRLDPQWQPLFAKGLASFKNRFWNEATGCLYDVVDVDGVAGQLDASVRPNQLFAVGGLPLTLIEPAHAARLLDVAEEKLWTPMGPRSLSPDDPKYASHYQGDVLARDGAYHQGTVWPWLTGAFVEAWVRQRGNTPTAKAEARLRFLKPQLLRLDLAGLRHVPEIADAEPPHVARGCPFQAWSLGEIQRLELQVLAI